MDSKTVLHIKILEDGRIITVHGYSRDHKIYVKRIRHPHTGEHAYAAEIDGYEPIVGEKAKHLFEKYFHLAKFKANL